jgi:hypothetical protein
MEGGGFEPPVPLRRCGVPSRLKLRGQSRSRTLSHVSFRWDRRFDAAYKQVGYGEELWWHFALYGDASRFLRIRRNRGPAGPSSRGNRWASGRGGILAGDQARPLWHLLGCRFGILELIKGGGGVPWPT